MKQVKHFFDSQIADVLRVQMDHSCINEETFLDNHTFNQLWHLLFMQDRLPQVFLQSLLKQTTEDFIDGLQVLLLHFARFVCLVWPVNHALFVQLVKD